MCWTRRHRNSIKVNESEVLCLFFLSSSCCKRLMVPSVVGSDSSFPSLSLLSVRCVPGPSTFQVSGALFFLGVFFWVFFCCCWCCCCPSVPLTGIKGIASMDAIQLSIDNAIRKDNKDARRICDEKDTKKNDTRRGSSKWMGMENATEKHGYFRRSNFILHLHLCSRETTKPKKKYHSFHWGRSFFFFGAANSVPSCHRYRVKNCRATSNRIIFLALLCAGRGSFV